MSPALVPPLDAVPLSSLAEVLARGEHDAVIVVGEGPLSKRELPAPLTRAIEAAEAADRRLTSSRTVSVLPLLGPVARLVLSTTPDLSAWEQDVRAISAATAAGVTQALAAGARRLLVVPAAPADARFARAPLVAALAALGAAWEPYELRAGAERPARAARVTLAADVGVEVARALEAGRVVARDIGGTEPEVMSPERMASYCEEVFRGTGVAVSVERDAAAITRGYPLVGAVARASLAVPRHHPRVIRLEYGPKDAARSWLLAGKGLVYDTGGADLKTDGHMAGMSRDKGGAAAVAGLLRVVAERAPKDVRIVALLGAVRNSVGSDSFVTDEILTSRAGVRVRVGNTDAEGRLVLADLLAALREEATSASALLSVATLTGHAAVAYGPFTALVPNGRARALAEAVLRAGEELGDPMERSSLRPEDYAFVAAKSPAEDVLSCNSLPSSRTPRGHQFPAAFLEIVSGLRARTREGGDLPFLHVDIAGSSVIGGSWQTGTPTGAPVVALASALSLV
ncbi:MAG: hypothetical protein IT374_20530 [Polyangiaceae bacterium]|nr:hypothetical protein [Polyangiaceae bacterium]